MKINEYNQMMKYLTRPAKPEYEQVAMAGPFKGAKKGADLLKKLLKKGDVKKGEAPKTDVEKVKSKVESDQKNIQELANEGQIPVKDQTDPSTLTTEELIEFRKTNRAGKGQFTNAEAIIARLENTIKEVKPGDEDYEYVTTTFPNFIKELKAKPELANNENVWNNLMSDLPADQRFVKYDDGTVDFQTKKTTHTFKLREDLDTDRKGPIAPDDDPNMFDDIFNKMYPDYSEGGKYELPLPGEEPLTPIKKKRTLNAEGGVIGEDGMFVGEDMGSRMGFRKYIKVADRPGNEKNLTKEKVVEYIKNNPGKTYSQHAKDLNKKGFKTAQGNKFTENNISVSIQTSGEKNLGVKRKAYTTDKELLKNIKNYFNKETKAGREVSRADIINKFFPETVEQYGTTSGTSAKTPALKAALGKNYKKLIFKGEQYEATQKIKNILQEVIDNERPIIDISNKVLQSETGVSERTISSVLNNNKTYVKNIRPKLRSVVERAPYNEEFQTVKVNDFDNLTKKFPRKISRPGSKQDFILQSMVRHAAQNGEKYKIISGDNFNNYKIRDNETGEILTRKNIIEKIKNKDPKYKEISNVYDELQLYKKTPFIDPITKKKTTLMAALRKATGIDNPLHVHHMKGVKTDPLNNLQVATYKANLGARMAKSTEDFKILGIRGIQEGGKNITGAPGFNIEQNIERFSKFANRKILSDAASGFQKIKTPTETLKKTTLKSVIPGAESLSKLTESIISDVAKGKIAAPALKALGIAGLGYGIYDTGVGFKEGVSGPELGARFFGLDPVYRYAQEQMSMTPEARQIYRDINREKAFEAEDVAGLGIFDLQPAKEVTEEEKQILETELEKIRQNRESLNQQRAQERADLLNIIQGKIDPNVVAYPSQFSEGGRVGFEKGGSSSDKKKTTPALDKPTIQIDPNAPVDPAKRDTLKGAGILGAGVALGKLGLLKLGKAAKVAKVAKVAPLTKVVAPLGKTMTEFPEWFPTLISRARKEGTQTPIYGNKQIKLTEAEYNKLSKEEAEGFYDSYMGRTDKYIKKLKAEGEPRYSKWVNTDEIIGYNYKLKDRPDLEITEYNGESISVTFPNAYGEPVEMYYKSPKGTKDAHFQIDDSVPELNWMGFQDDHHVDFYGETVNNLDEVYGGASDLEQYVLKTKKPRTTQGDEVVARADAQFDVIKDTAEDLDEF